MNKTVKPDRFISNCTTAKKDDISKLSKGDRIVFYSAKEKFGDKIPYQKFTAIGNATDDEPYQPDNNPAFKLYRRNINFKKAKKTDIHPLSEKLTFIKNKQRWGFYLISGFRELSEDDFSTIQKAMF